MEEKYIVQPGDTLSRIAVRRMGRASGWVELAHVNGLIKPSLLLVGQVLTIPQRGSVLRLTEDRITKSVLQGGPTIEVVGELGGSPAGSVTPHETEARLAPARGFMFVVFEQLPEVGTGKVIRKVMVVPKDYSLHPTNPARALTPAEHAMHGGPRGSPYLSGSARPIGAASMTGEPLLIDLAKASAAGGRIVTVAELVADLRRYAQANPSASARITQLIWAVEKIEGETLIKGSVPGSAVRPLSAQHKAYTRSAEEIWGQFSHNKITQSELEQGLAALEKSYRRARIIGRVGRVVMVVGLILTVKDVAEAADRSIARRSFKPIASEVFRQALGWDGAVAGARIGALAGAAFGIETGPGAIAFAAVGAIVFGALGYFGADLVAQAAWGGDE